MRTETIMSIDKNGMPEASKAVSREDLPQLVEWLSLKDEKPITVRQCIQSLGKITLYKPELRDKIAGSLISFPLMEIKETMRKSILLDILNVLLAIRAERKTDEIEGFILNALSGGILDKKSKKQIEILLQYRGMVDGDAFGAV